METIYNEAKVGNDWRRRYVKFGLSFFVLLVFVDPPMHFSIITTSVWCPGTTRYRYILGTLYILSRTPPIAWLFRRYHGTIPGGWKNERVRLREKKNPNIHHGEIIFRRLALSFLYR